MNSCCLRLICFLHAPAVLTHMTLRSRLCFVLKCEHHGGRACRMCHSAAAEAFYTSPSRKQLYKAHRISGEGEVGEICGFLVTGGRCWGSSAAFVGLSWLWNSWTQYISCWSPQEVSILHSITSVGLPAWFNGLQLF